MVDWKSLRTKEIMYPFFAGIAGVFIGVASLFIMRFAVTLDWIEKHQALAGWVQAVGSIATLAWGVYLFDQNNKYQITKEKERVKSQGLALTESVKIAYMCVDFATTMCAKKCKEKKLYGDVVFSDFESAISTMNNIDVVQFADTKITGHFRAARTSLLQSKRTCERINTIIEGAESEKIHEKLEARRVHMVDVRNNIKKNYDYLNKRFGD